MHGRAKPSSNSRLRIGLLFDTLWDFEGQIWRGVVDGARAQDIDVISFAVGSFNSPYAVNANRTALYDLIGPQNVDGLLAISGAIGAFIDRDQLREHLRRFNMPLISLSTAFDDLPCALVDNSNGMHELTAHFIKEHNRKRLAFITGPETNFDSNERLEAFKQVLAENDVPFDPQLVVTGNFAHESGGRAILTLVKERNATFDAVIAANDNMALDAARMLQALGLKVPEQVLVGGFDDTRDARTLRPPLTTVRQPTYELGRRAVDDMVHWLKTGTPATTVRLPARLVIRGSCGCQQTTSAALAAAKKTVSIKHAKAEDIVKEITDRLGQRFKIVSDVLGSNTWAQRLIESYVAEYKGEPDAFRNALEAIFIEAESTPVEPGVWGEILHYLFGLLDVRLAMGSGARDAAFLFVNQYTEMRQIASAAAYAVEASVLQSFQQPISAAFDGANLNRILCRELPRLNIHGFWLSLYEDSAVNTKGACYPLLHFEQTAVDKQESHVYSKEDAPRFPAHDLVPGKLETKQHGRWVNVYPLFFEQHHFALAVFHIGNLSSSLYEMLINNLTSLMQGYRVLDESRHYTEKLQSDVAVRTAELRKAHDDLQEKHREIEKLNAELVHKNKIDVLTDLYNRGALYEFLRMELNRTRRNRKRERDDDERRGGDFHTFSVMMCDLDHFKRINDEYGHLAGDQVLKAVGDLLKRPAVLRQEDVAGRFGGEEFIVVLANTDGEHAQHPAHRFVEQLKQTPFKTAQGETFYVTVSVGISQYRDGDNGEEDVVRRADHALYYAKNHGRDQVVIYEHLPKSERLKDDDAPA